MTRDHDRRLCGRTIGVLAAALALTLAHSAAAQTPPEPAPWWSQTTSIWVGSIGGSLIGLLGAVIGTLGGRGKARRLVMSLLASLILIGILCLAAGLIALTVGQPYAVWYPLLLGGGICTLVGIAVFPALAARYRADELRKMQSMDARAAK